jgi:RHS repeat-associated protein
MAAGQLGGPLYPTHEIEDKEKEKKINFSFGEAIQEWNKHEYKKAVKLFRKHIEDYPDSPWASEAILHIGCDAQYNGRYTEAEESFKWILEKNKDKDYEGAKVLVSKAKLRLGVLKVYQNNFTEALNLFTELKQESSNWRDRTYASHWILRLSQYTANELAMLNCGTQALAYLLEKDGREANARKMLELLPETTQGHSIKDLSEIAAQYGYHFTATRVSALEIKELPLPAIMHISGKGQGDSGHYWILEKVSENRLGLFDPQAGRRFDQSIEEFSQEWSGIALVFSDTENIPGIKLAESEMGIIYGGCCGAPRAETNQGDPGRNEAPQSLGNNSPCGTPIWSVNMVNFNLYIVDVPLWYSTPIGPSVEIRLNYNSQSAIAYNEPFGNKWQFNYASYLIVDTGGNVTIFMPDGRRDTYTPDGSGGYTKPYQVFNTLTKIAENHFELRFRDDTVYVYKIPAGTTSLQPFLVEIRESHGQKITFGYDSNVRLTTITDSLGRVTTLTYNAADLVTQVTDPFGRSATFEYDANNNLTKITDMGGYWTSFTYDGDVYLTSLENERGKWGFYIEPADGIPNGSNDYPAPGGLMWQDYRITVANPLGGKEEYHYTGNQFYGWYVSPKYYMEYKDYNNNNFRSNVPKIRYDYTSTSGQRGEIRKILYPEGGYVEYGYDGSGNRTSIKDAYGHITYYTFNHLGKVTSITDPKANVTNMTYGTNGIDLLQIQSGLGTIAMTYNSTHDVTSMTDRLGNTTTYTYNSFGQKTSQTDALSIVTTYTYNANQLLQQVIKDGKTLDSYTYDTIGRVKTHTDATGLTLIYDYNNLNHTTKITYPDGKYTIYAYAGCCPRLVESMTDRSGRATYYIYDSLERLTDTVNPEGGVIHNEYDADGKLIKLIDPNSNVTTFEYDKDNRLTKKTYTDGKYISFAYDSTGLLTSRTNARGITTNYTYDQNHNLLTNTYSDSTTGVTYQYDNYNRVMQRQNGIGTHQYTYDANSRLISVDGPWVNDTLTYQYDALGNRISLQPQGGQVVSYLYDTLNRLTGIQIGTNTYSYVYSNANPLVQSLNRPNGSFTTYQYDTLNRLTDISNKNSASAIINKYVYAYNNQDMRSSETITNGNPITSFQNELITYDYNKVNQLLHLANPGEVPFTFDGDGNMTLGYTPEGYPVTATYDAENRAKSAEYTDGSGVVHRIELFYSGEGFLSERKNYENNVLINDIRFIQDGFLPIQIRNAGNNVAHEYAWGLNLGGGIGGLLNLNFGGQNYSYIYDGKGNVTALVDASQAVVAAYTYDTFGNLMSKTGTLDQPFKFSTKIYDEKVGLSYYGYRFYSPALGRWLTRDPLGEAGGINLYGFVRENPINLLDPLGLSPDDSCSLKQEEKDDWQWYCDYGICYRARKVKDIKDLNFWQKMQLLLKDLMDAWMAIPGTPGPPILPSPNDPRYEIDPNSFRPDMNGNGPQVMS